MTVLATDSDTDPSSLAAARGSAPPLRTAVVGLDRAGVLHAAVLSAIPGCELAGVADRDATARRSLRGLGFSAPSFETAEKLLARTSPQALFVSAPVAERAAVVRLALEAGVPVLVDRPAAPALAEARALAALAAEKKVPFACGHPLAFHPVFAAVRSALDAGVLGAIRRVRASIYLSSVFSTREQTELAPPESGGGVLLHAGSELAFLLIWYLGVPESVRATAKRLYGPHEDELHAMMTMPGGVEAGMDCSWSVPGYPRPATVIEMEGEHGTLLASDDALELDLARAAGPYLAGATRLGPASLPQAARFDVDGDAPYLLDASFLAWAAGGVAPPHRFERSLAVWRVVDALYASVAGGGSSASVPE